MPKEIVWRCETCGAKVARGDLHSTPGVVLALANHADKNGKCPGFEWWRPLVWALKIEALGRYARYFERAGKREFAKAARLQSGVLIIEGPAAL